MESTASSSTEPSAGMARVSLEEPRPQAGPLPTKQGEIGFQEGVHDQHEANRLPSPVPTALPERHPADRDAPPAISPSVTQGVSAAPVSSATAVPPSTNAAASSDDVSSTNSIAKRKKFFCFFKPKNVPSYKGILLTTFLYFLAQLILLGGTITAWVFAVQMLSKKGQDVDKATAANISVSSSIFIHVVFAIAVLGQLLFLERRIFRLRAERYAFVHPGEMLPTSRRRRGLDPNIPYSPWNRPPLPTYAAALAESGVGTGDVEDHIIAAPPPPAYGNTRGSTLLLAGFLRNSLRAQRPASAQSQMTWVETSRPVSYQSRDEEWEAIQDAERARKLEETLARLERPGSRQAGSS